MGTSGPPSAARGGAVVENPFALARISLKIAMYFVFYFAFISRGASQYFHFLFEHKHHKIFRRYSLFYKYNL
jgi:hypothetical protein